MNQMKPAGIAVAKLAVTVGPFGLGVPGVVLMAMAVLFPGAVPTRIAVFSLGVGGIVIAGGFMQGTRSRDQPA